MVSTPNRQWNVCLVPVAGLVQLAEDSATPRDVRCDGAWRRGDDEACEETQQSSDLAQRLMLLRMSTPSVVRMHHQTAVPYSATCWRRSGARPAREA
jgi:hypothetical protein